MNAPRPVPDLNHPPAAVHDPPGAETAVGLVRVRAWDRVVRITHWVIAFGILILSITGIYIGHPYIVVPGEARFHFVMGTMKVVHFYTAIAFTLAVLGRIVWMFTGSVTARWNQFIPAQRKRQKALLHTLMFYLFLKKRPPACIGHNPLAGAAYGVIFMLYLVMITTGLALYAPHAIGSPLGWFDWIGPLYGGVETARWIHHVVMWMLIGFFIHHLYSATLVAMIEKNGTLDSIVSGYKWVPPEDLEE